MKVTLVILFLQFNVCLEAKKNIFKPSTTTLLFAGLFSSNQRQEILDFTIRANISSGHYNTPQKIFFTTTGDNIDFFYTVNGQNPTLNSDKYPKDGIPIYALSGLVIKILASKNGKIGQVYTFQYSYSTLKTGRTTSSLPGDDGDLELGVSRSFKLESSQTILDEATGLSWQKCQKGLSGNNCEIGIAEQNNSTDSKSYCGLLNLNSKTWRLPTLFELKDLVNYENSFPSINTIFFPNTASGIFWTNDSFPPDTSKSWTVEFANGKFSNSTNTNLNNTRCVSGYSNPRLAPVLVDQNNETILDKSTNLTWQKCYNGLSGNCLLSVPIADWNNSISTLCSNSNLANKTWRVPNINELSSLIDRSKTNTPTIDQNLFISGPIPNHWSSTRTGSSAWYLNINNLNIYNEINGISYSYGLRCVSGP